MSQIDLFDAFNNCVDRMNAGESIEDCLRDYPEHAARLRQLLEAGELVFRAQYPGAEVADEQAQVRARVVQAMQRKPKEIVIPRRNWFIPLMAVASLVLVVGFVSVVMLATRSNPQELAYAQTSTVAYYRNATTEMLFNATLTQAAVVAMSSVTAEAMPATAIGATGMPTLPARDQITPDSEVTLAGIEQIQQTATSLALIFDTTPTHDLVLPPTWTPVLGPIGASMTPALPHLNEVQQTATSLALLFAATPTLEGTTVVGGGGGGGIAAVPTSVALMSPVPSTPVAAMATPTGSVSHMTPAPTEVVAVLTLAPIGSTTPRPTTTVTPTGTPAPSSTPMPTLPPGTQSVSSAPTPIEVIPLSAGEIDDNANWDNYLTYRNSFLSQYGFSVHNVDVTGRHLITVVDSEGFPVPGALVKVFAGSSLVSMSRTYATGQTLFFPNANPAASGVQSYLVMVQKGNSPEVAYYLNPSLGSSWIVTVPAARSSALQLDVVFLLDATGSMGDEIAQLQNNLLAISQQIALLPGSVDVRYGLVTYRDRGDAYVTQAFDFTPDVGSFQAQLSNVRADAGGDTPESLNEGLHVALYNMSWRGDDTVKLIFLVADAPPHLDYPNDYDYARDMVVAAEKGIKIHPIASSGLSPDGEFIFRQIAQYTMGHFLFLTYQQGSSGAPGSDRSDLSVGEPSDPSTQIQGDYTVERLDELVLRLITDELSALNRLVSQSGIAVQTQPLYPVPEPSTAGPFRFPSLTPSPTWTPTPTPMDGGVMPQPTATASVTGDSGLTLPFILTLVGLSVFFGYSLRPRNLEKRKNDAKKRIRVDRDER